MKITVDELNCPDCLEDVQEILINGEISFCCVNCGLHFTINNREVQDENIN